MVLVILGQCLKKSQNYKQLHYLQKVLGLQKHNFLKKLCKSLVHSCSVDKNTNILVMTMKQMVEL